MGSACSCVGGYSGDNCEIAPPVDPVDLCASVDCGDHGVCSEGQCTCNGGYTGDRCEIAGTPPPRSPTYNLVLDQDFAALVDEDVLSAFKRNVKEALAAVMGIDISRIIIVSVRPGSTTVDFYVEDAPDSAPSTALSTDAAIMTLLQAVQDDSSTTLEDAFDVHVGAPYVPNSLEQKPVEPPPEPSPEPTPEPQLPDDFLKNPASSGAWTADPIALIVVFIITLLGAVN
jgi:hypothetical protein